MGCLMALFVLVFLPGRAFSQYFQSAVHIGSPHYDFVYKTIAAENGSYYVAGSAYSDSLLAIQSGIGQCLFLAKFDSAGAVVWVQKSYNGNHASVSNICLDPAGNVYLTGTISGSHVMFDTEGLVAVSVLNTINQESAYVVKFDGQGNGLWGKRLSGTRSVGASSIAAAPDGRLYLTGAFTGAITLNGPTFTSLGNKDASGAYPTDIFLACLSAANGSILWGKQAGAPGKHDYAGHVGTDAHGNVYLSGTVQGAAAFGGVALGNSGNLRFLLAKCDAAGEIKWVRSMGGGNPTWPTNMVVDATGNCYVSGCNNYSEVVSLAGVNYYPKVHNSGVFIAKFNALGKGQWARPGGNFLRGLCLDKDQNVLFTGTYSNGYPEVYPGYPVLPAGGSNIWVGKLSAGGALRWIRQTGGPGDEDAYTICAPANTSLVVAGTFRQSATFDGHSFQNFSNQHYSEDIFIARLKEGPPATVNGAVFIDSDGSGTWDTHELPAPGMVLALDPEKGYSVTGPDGRFTLYTVPGSYKVQVPDVPKHHKISTAAATATLPGFGHADTVAHIGLAPIPGILDVTATLTAMGGVRPGFPVQFLLTYKNEGTTAMSSILRLAPDPLLEFTSSLPVCTANNGLHLDWAFVNLQPGEQRNITISFVLPATVPIGTVLFSEVFVSPQWGYEVPGYKHYTFEHTVTGSYDPNDKQVHPAGPISPARVAAQEPLEYTIRFQNTGTDTAFTVLITDYLSPLLQPASIKVLASSHPHTFTLADDGFAQWRFDNILLPDSGRNQAASNGFVKFRIRPRATLQIGDTIANTAQIYFDFNSPIITNTTSTVVRPVKSASLAADQFALFPNPAHSSFYLYAKELAEAQTAQLIFRNAAGAVVFEKTARLSQGNSRVLVSVQDLPAGLYLLQVVVNGQQITKKVVMQPR